jgi:hypothetical protein
VHAWQNKSKSFILRCCFWFAGRIAGEQSMQKGLALGVARWQAARVHDMASNMQLDGSSPCCLFRAVMYQRSGICSAVKACLCSEGVFNRIPVRAPNCAVCASVQLLAARICLETLVLSASRYHSHSR